MHIFSSKHKLHLPCKHKLHLPCKHKLHLPCKLRTSKMQKKIIRAFEYMGLKIEISCNLKIVNFLDVTLSLNDNSYKPFSKANATPTYIHVNSYHSASRVKANSSCG